MLYIVQSNTKQLFINVLNVLVLKSSYLDAAFQQCRCSWPQAHLLSHFWRVVKRSNKHIEKKSYEYT